MPGRSLLDETLKGKTMHMQHRRRFLTLLTVFLFAVTLGALPAAAASLDELRSAGVVGERYDGLAVVRDTGASAQIRAQVDEVNAQRRQIYAKRASEQGVPADQVGRVYAQEIVRNAPRGTWFLGEDGNWTKK
ncbi:MAG: YdbL family protein [Alphaproteobacteria bacterium]|nr:YdbL family protein [Alphaproteobacteria bacterium]